MLRLVEIAYEARDVEDYRTALSTYKALAILAGHIPEAGGGSFTSAEEGRRVCTRLGVARQDLRGQR